MARRFGGEAVLLAVLAACGGPADNSALFSGPGGATGTAIGGSPSAGSPGGGATGISGGGTSGGLAGQTAGGSAGSSSATGSSGTAGNGSAAGSTTAGTSSVSGGAGDGGGAGSKGCSSPGGEPKAGSSSVGDCGCLGSSATYYSLTQHCYLVMPDSTTYAAAKAHCAGLGAHLVTLSSQEENDFVWSLTETQQWIGASDGKGAKEEGAGTYTWVNGEPFTFNSWSAEQPNASATECGDSNGGGTCYEHCAFQWTGGEREGQWNDRYCFHTIASVCESDGSGAANAVP